MAMNVVRVVLVLVPVALAARMAMVWSRLPESMATHFGTSGEADSYLPRLVFLLIAVGVPAFTASLFFRRQGDPFGQAIASGITVLIGVAFWQVVAFNLGEGRVSIAVPAAAGGVAALVVLAIVRMSAGGPRDESNPGQGRAG